MRVGVKNYRHYETLFKDYKKKYNPVKQCYSIFFTRNNCTRLFKNDLRNLFGGCDNNESNRPIAYTSQNYTKLNKGEALRLDKFFYLSYKTNDPIVKIYVQDCSKGGGYLTYKGTKLPEGKGQFVPINILDTQSNNNSPVDLIFHGDQGHGKFALFAESATGKTSNPIIIKNGFEPLATK